MTKKSIKKIGLLVLVGVIIASSIGAYLFFKPHRDVQAADAFAELKASELLNEFSIDANKANSKYLSSDGNSKVLIIEGLVSKITANQNGESVIVLKETGAKVGVSATLIKDNKDDVLSVKIGDIIKVKGAITAGNHYDEDLDLYEHAILVQCKIVK